MGKGITITILIVALLLVGLAGFFILKNSSRYSTASSDSSPSTNNQASIPTNQTYEIQIRNFQFSPSTLNIQKGNTVTWTNKDSAPHTVTSDSGSELNSQTLNKDQTYSHTFNTEGTFNYYCTFHQGMRAKVIVS